jgi:capsular exopolysaccharide synthesis family protein
MYKSQASVVVQPAGTQSSSLQAPDMATEKGIVSSAVVLNIAAHALHLPMGQLSNGLSVASPGSTYLLNIAYSNPNKYTAQQRAEAIAEAYVTYRTPKPPPESKSGKPAKPVVITTPTATLITPASLPTSQSSPKPALDYSIAVVLGLGLGISTAAIRDRLSDGLRGPADLVAGTAAPLLALIPAFWRFRRKPSRRLVMLRRPESVVADAYRTLRTRIVRAADTAEARTLIVTSPAREDTDMVAANLAVALAQSGLSAILVCADLRWGQAHRFLGLDANEGIIGVIDRRAFVDNVLVPTAVPGLEVLPAGGPALDTGAVLQRPAFRTMLGVVIDRADFVVITAPPVLAGADAQVLADLADLTLVVADARRSTRAQLRTAMRELAPVHDKIVGCVLTGVGRRRLLWRPRFTIHAGNGLHAWHGGATNSDEPAFRGDKSDSHPASADSAPGQTPTATTDAPDTAREDS